jgi:hypothetical protein
VAYLLCGGCDNDEGGSPVVLCGGFVTITRVSHFLCGGWGLWRAGKRSGGAEHEEEEEDEGAGEPAGLKLIIDSPAVSELAGNREIRGMGAEWSRGGGGGVSGAPRGFIECWEGRGWGGGIAE